MHMTTMLCPKQMGWSHFHLQGIMGHHTDTDVQDRLYTQVHRDLSVFTDVHGSELYAQVCMNFVCRYH